MLVSLHTTVYPREESWEDLQKRIPELYRQGKVEEVIKTAERAVKVAEEEFGPENSNVAVSYENLASLYVLQGKQAEAVPLLEGVVKIYEKVNGPYDVSVFSALKNLAGAYFALGRYGEVEGLLDRQVTIVDTAFDPDHPGTTTLLEEIAETYRVIGKVEKAATLEVRVQANRDKRDPAALGLDSS